MSIQFNLRKIKFESAKPTDFASRDEKVGIALQWHSWNYKCSKADICSKSGLSLKSFNV